MKHIRLFTALILCTLFSIQLYSQGYNTLSFGASGVQHEDTLYFGDSIHVSFWLVNTGTTPIYDFVSIISNTYDINGTQIGWGTLGGSLNYYNTDSSLTVGDSIPINITASVTLFSYILGDNIIEIWPGLAGLGNVVDTSLTPVHILNSNPGGPTVYIPDTNFKALLISPWSGINTNGDSEIQVSEAASYTFNLNVGMSNISDLTGIEAFVNLTEFSCYGNQLTSLDLSQNTALTYLNCQDNQLTSLDLSHNSALDILYCEDNQLTSLNLNGAVSLGAVWADYNQLTSLDLSTNINLEVLEVTGNQLASLDVSQNPVLNRLDCEGQNWPNSQLTTLDLSQNPNLQYVNCGQNQITSLNLNGTISLVTLYCQKNQLSSLDLSTNTILGSLFCPYNQITSLDVTQNISPSGLSLFCNDNALINLDIRNGLNTLMWSMHCFNNLNLTCINVDDSVFMYNWMANSPNPPQVQIDPQQYFSNNCPSNPLSLQEQITNKELLKTTDILGRETKGRTNEPLFYIYDDGTIEKRIIIE